MMCSVFNCPNSRAGTGETMSMWYAFPKNPNLRIAWESACANPKLSSSADSSTIAICGQHFKDSDFMDSVQCAGLAIKRLNFGSLPSQNLPENAYANFPKERPPRRTIIERQGPPTSDGQPGALPMKRKSDDQAGHSGATKLQKVVRIQSKVEVQQLEEINRLKTELASAMETQNVLQRQVNQFYKVFTQAQLKRLFSHGAANLAKKFFKSSLVAEAVEQRTSGSSFPADHNYIPGQDQENAVPDEIDDAAFERCMSHYKGIVTRLKTT